MTLCICDRCGVLFPPLAYLTEQEWLCRACWLKAGGTIKRYMPTAAEIHAAELATREDMLRRGGADAYRVRAGKS